MYVRFNVAYIELKKIAGSIPVNRDAVDKFDSYKASGHWYVSCKWGSAVSLFLNRENWKSNFEIINNKLGPPGFESFDYKLTSK